MEKPNVNEYLQWMRETLAIDLHEARYRTIYELNATQLLTEAEKNVFFVNLDSVLANASYDYDSEGKYDLLMSGAELRLKRKPYDSIVNKSYRKNVVQNSRFPDEPAEGWIVPSNWYSKFNDIIRGTIVTKYIDGPEFIANKLQHHATKSQLGSHFDMMNSDNGYYAYHFYSFIPVEVANLDLSTSRVELSIEIQLTTQLQEVLRQLTHGFYEALRDGPAQGGKPWKWDFDSPRFKASYLVL